MSGDLAIETAAGTSAHTRYLERVGFHLQGETLELDLAPG